MSTLTGIVMVPVALVSLLGSWVAARPVRDPTRRYTPLWLPAMVVGELAPLFLIAHVVAIGTAVGLGAHERVIGQVGVVVLCASALLLVALMVQARVAVRRLRAHIDGPIHGVTGRARLTGVPVPAPRGVEEILEVPWRHGLSADITRPRDIRDPLPVLVYVHGGGWTGGDPQRQARDMYHAMALAGWVTVAIRYPFAPSVSVEHQVETVRAAVRWARTGLGGHGLTASTVAIAGGSAGAHLATMAALTASTSDEQVAACVGMYGVYDMANRNRTRATWGTTSGVVMQATVAEAPDRYRAMSPLDQIHEGSPPVLLVHGTRDTLVPVGEAQQFGHALRAAGRPVTEVEVLGAEHAFDGVSSPRSRASAAVVRDWLERTVPR